MININWKNMPPIPSPYIKGEYKYMPKGSKMPEGWKKVFTSNSTVLIGSHIQEKFNGNFHWKQTWGSSSDTDTLDFTPGTNGNYIRIMSTKTSPMTDFEIKYEYVDIWQYDPNNEF